MPSLRHSVRVIFGDTDQMGVVYYANYLRYFEGSRAALLRSVGFGGTDLSRWGVGFPVIEAHCRYIVPARYEDLLDVVVEVTEIRAASLRFDYRVERGDDRIAEGFTRHACVATDNGRPCRLPRELASRIS